MSRLAAPRHHFVHVIESRSVRSAVAAIAAMILVAATLFHAPVASGASGTSEPTGTKRAESVLWWNDGSWWANMWDTATSDFHIFRLDLATQSWVNTGTPTDTRTNSHADVLWAGGHLYVASHLTIPDENPAVSGYPSYLYRFSYNATTKSYSLDAGFPVQINNYKTETLVIDRDSTGKLWATWQQDNKIYVNRTIGGDDHVWGTPFQLPVTATDVTVDDNSAVIAFHGDKVGVMWSNQSSANDAMWFAVHEDGQPDTTWSAARTAIQGSNTADDHMNLKSIQADGSGRVYAAVKTSFTSSAQPLIMLLVRDTVTGDWANYPIARVSDCPNRVLVLIDEQNRVLHAFYSAPAPTAYACNSSGGEIDEKTSSLDSIAFPVGAGTPVILDYGTVKMHNASSTKQNVNSQTGIVVLARNNDTDHYWHHYESLGGSPPPAPVANFSATPTSGTTPLNVQFTDTSTNSPTSWSWTFGDGGTSTAKNPSHSYSTAGTYTVTLTATNAGGSDAEQKADYISVTQPPAPVAAFTGTPTSGIAPLNVQFTDQSTNSPTSWLWNFGDNSTSTAQSPSHTYATAGSYTVTLTATNSGGSDGETKTNYITATSGGVTASFAGTPTSGHVPLTVAFTDTSTGSPTGWSWTFGDGGTSTLQNPSHEYTSAGTYTVALTASKAGSTSTATRTNYITVTPPAPVANFTSDRTSGTVPFAVQFTDTSTGSPTSWAWTFGDGATSTAQNPSHTYTSAGTYTVALTATNAGGSDTKTATNYITAAAPPDFSVSASPAKQTIVRGGGTTYTVTVTPLNGFTGSVSLAVTGLPAASSTSFNPTSLVSGTSILSVTTTSSTKVGSFTLTITGSSGSISHSTVVTLQVKRK
jgi:PKD repeat protein